jgi:hypothetical protein
MRALTKLTRSGWLTAGLATGLILAPGGAMAASVLILHGANGPAVNATSGNQLLTAEAPPSSWRSIEAWGIGRCVELPAISATQSFIVRQVILTDTAAQSPYGVKNVWLFDNSANCSSELFGQAAFTDQPTTSSQPTIALPFSPGIAVPPGGHLWANIESDVGTNAAVAIQVLGYTVPRADAPAVTPVTYCTKAACG